MTRMCLYPGDQIADTLTASGMSGSKVGRGQSVNRSNGTSNSVGRGVASLPAPRATART
jgi:hypothetical protein